MRVKGLKAGKTTARETAKVRAVDDAMIDAILPHLSHVVAGMVRVQRATGMRPGEVCLMRTCDIDTTGAAWTYKPSRHKTEHHGDDHQRIVLIGPKGQEALREFLKPLNPTAYVFCPRESVAEMRQHRRLIRKTPIRHDQGPGRRFKKNPKRQAGDRYTPAVYRVAIKRACGLAFPVPADIADDPIQSKAWRSAHRFHPHQIRHTAATMIKRSTGDIDAVRVILGHKSIKITETYVDRDVATAARVAAMIG